MTPRPIDLDTLRTHLQMGIPHDWLAADPTAPPLVLVDLDKPASHANVPAPGVAVPFVVVGLTTQDPPELHPDAAACDIIVAHDSPAVDTISCKVAAQPLAATALAQVLRGSAQRSIEDGLLVESAIYSALQAGPEFARWRASRPTKPRAAESDTVGVARLGGRLDITLTRPHVHNALNTTMRDALVDALNLAALDETIVEVHLQGAGPSFCAGGDLDEFGSLPDPATAHHVRLSQNPGRSIAAVADRVTAHLHGACFGAGIELPAFASTVTTSPDTTIALPEVDLGLIPGAGGTVSIPRRIGRHRTARLALTGERLDASTAVQWGLVDNIDDT